MTLDDNTPIVVGVGEASERIQSPDYQAWSPVDLASEAAKRALEDAGGAHLAGEIDTLASIRQFEISTPGAVAPFGASNNFPRSVANRIGANPARAILEVSGGQGPQHLVNEMAHAIAEGRVGMALIVGSEAISTVRHLQTSGETRDWSEQVEGQLEDRGYGLGGLLSEPLISHGARTPIQLYALFENARRQRLGLGREDYRQAMAELFAPFTNVAAGNPHAMSQEVYSAEALATVTAQNRLTSDPFPRRMVARDQANQGAAVLLTSVGAARRLGVAEDRWIFLHGGADVAERTPIEREDLSRSPASVAAAKAGLAAAGVSVDEIDLFDLYSCFPIAVFNLCEGLGLDPQDPRGLTLTGGLPFFGGAGNNYSMHAIASMVRSLRERPDARGFIGANGGFLSKYSVGVYSATPRAWTGFSSSALQAEVNAWAAPALADPAAGRGIVETYTIDYSAPEPRGLVIGSDSDGRRFTAMTGKDSPLVQALIAQEPLGGEVAYSPDDKGRLMVTAFSPATV